mmetsp:Transcript_45119/g.94634  ORF Transcript_45119/g.94634 Transcript_45119/m.94634 type:complete len:201 (-) Transcript_45119:12-614(-)
MAGISDHTHHQTLHHLVSFLRSQRLRHTLIKLLYKYLTFPRILQRTITMRKFRPNIQTLPLRSRRTRQAPLKFLFQSRHIVSHLHFQIDQLAFGRVDHFVQFGMDLLCLCLERFHCLLYLRLTEGGGCFAFLVSLEVKGAVFVPFGLEYVGVKIRVDFGRLPSSLTLCGCRCCATGSITHLLLAPLPFVVLFYCYFRYFV